MSDIIKLLPDAIANQIAAGEVIQRPASVVKELMENAVDARADQIKLILKDAGKTLIQVIDNGSGMSATDARMCFERHATSKIRKSDDLFHIKTMGFRGEAMASIASIAHVALITKTADEDLGTQILINGSKLEKQEPCTAPTGTSISVKNLFYNVPARRKFLKKDPTELKHILDEFQRIALAHPEIHFSLHHNESELYHLTSSNLRKRIVALFGKGTNEKLVPVLEETEWVKIEGFVGKPEFAKRSKGEQFIFVNRRFIKSNYINHAIRSSFEELIAKEAYPLYVLFLELDPSKIDINVHPTKQEIKFEDERLIYNYVKVTIRHAIGKYTLTPVIDFDEEQAFVDQLTRPDRTSATDRSSSWSPRITKDQRETSNIQNWESVYQEMSQDEAQKQSADLGFEHIVAANTPTLGTWTEKKKPYQLHASYIISPIKSGFMLIDQEMAHQRILYESHLGAIGRSERLSQNQLFAETVEFNTVQSTLLNEILDKINFLGFDIENFGDNTFVVRAIPPGFTSKDLKSGLEQMLEQYAENSELKLSADENLSRAIAVSSSVRKGQALNVTEMEEMINKLFACKEPYISPFGKKCFITMELDDIKKRFKET